MLVHGEYFYSDIKSFIFDFDNQIVNRTTKIKFKHNNNIVDTTGGRLLIFNATDILIDYTLDKKGIIKLISKINKENYPHLAAKKLKLLQDLCFQTVTKYGLSLSVNDFSKPKEYSEDLLTTYHKSITMPKEERPALWDEIINKLVNNWKLDVNKHNPLKIMMESGARVTDTQIRQMVVAKGLLSNMDGTLKEDAIYSSLAEGLNSHEYFQTCGPARRGLADNFFVVPASGYLERQLITITRDLVINSEDCKTTKGIVSSREGSLGRYLISGKLVTNEILDTLPDNVIIRSPTTCTHNNGLCKICCGINPANFKPWWRSVGIGVIAAQTLSEVTTQLGLRGKHQSGSVTLSSSTKKVDNILANIIKQVGGAGTTNVKVGLSEKLSPNEIEGSTYEERVMIFVNELNNTYKSGNANIAQIYFEVLARALSDISVTVTGTTAIRSQGFNDNDPKLKNISFLVRNNPSWIKSLGFGYILNNIKKALLTIEPSADLPSELLMEGKFENHY